MAGEKSIRLSVFGQFMQLVSSAGGWKAYYTGSDGKRRPAHDVVIPSQIEESEVIRYVADICHEWTSEEHPDVVIVEPPS